MIDILAFEDRAPMRDSIEMLLNSEEDFNLLHIYSNCQNIVNHVQKHNPNIILMDIDMPEINGIEGVKMVKNNFPDIYIIMLTVFDDEDKIFESIKAGANSYILKKNIPVELVNAIHNTSNGGSSISPGIANKVLNAFRKIETNIEKDIYGLSKRENEVLSYLVKGYSYKMIASENNVSVETIRSHIKNIYIKLQVNSATEAVVKALKNKIV